MNLASIIATHEASRRALVDGEQSITFGTLRTWAAAVRQRLTDEGFGPGDRIVVAAENEPKFVAAILGIMGIGAIVVPMKPTNPLPELERKLAAVEPRAILVGDGADWMFKHADVIGAPLIDMSFCLSATADSVAGAPPIVARSDDDYAFFMLTSGVSGDPKVAMLSHHNLRWVQEAIINMGEDALGPDDVALGSLPFAHIFGLNAVLLACLNVGATVVLQRRFDVDGSLDLIRRHGVTTLAGAPPMWQRWAAADVPDDTLATVKYAASGAAALPHRVFEAVRDRFGIEVGEGYGLTETSPIVTASRGIKIKPTSVGRPIDGVDVMLVEPDGTPVEHGDTGEVVVRSPGVFKGYLNDAVATNQVLTPDGWFWTGDVGVFDDDGYLYLVDRVKDLIIVSGFNVYPAEVENILLEHPAVRGAIVVSAPHIETGETVVAHVSGDVDQAELAAFVRTRLSRYKCPTEYHFVDELPVAPTGKLMRRELR